MQVAKPPKEASRDDQFRELMDSLRNKEIELSYTSISEFLKSPRHFIRYKLKEKVETDRMRLGNIFHKSLLEPIAFDSTYIPEPNVEMPSSKNQAKYCELVAGGMSHDEALDACYKSKPKDHQKFPETFAAWIEFISTDLNGKEILPRKDYDMIIRLRDAVLKNPASRSIYNEIEQTEKGIKFEAFGFKWRGFIDGFSQSLIMDLKWYSAGVDERTMRNAIMYNGLGLQASLYTFGPKNPQPYFVVAVDNGGNVSVTEVSQATRKANWADLEYYMSRFRTCINLNQFNQSYDFWADRNGIYKV